MASLTVRNIDERVKIGLRLRAARNGRSMEEEVRIVLREAANEDGGEPAETESERRERVRRMLSYGRPDPEPFDLKAFSDALSDGSE